MNWLVEQLPDHICETPVYTDYRHMMRIDALFRDPAIPDAERVALAIDLFYKEDLPANISLEEAIGGLLYFYGGGEEPDEQGEKAPGGKQACDFEQDFRYIYAAFQQAYNIDLEQESLHWWKFLALFAALPEDTSITKIMGYRLADPSKAPKEQRAQIMRLQKQYKIKKPHEKAPSQDISAVETAYRKRTKERFERVAKARGG